MFRINNILAASIVAAMAATQAHAAVVIPQPPELVGGGATLPAIAYVGSGWLAGTSADPGVASRLSTTNPNVLGSAVNLTPADTDSLFGVFAVGSTNSIPAGGTKAVKTPNPNVSYCQTGSGTGRKVVEGVNAATGACTDYNTGIAAPTGFGAPVDAQFGASDAPFLASDYSAFISHRAATKTEPVQFPSVAGAIAVVYNAGTSGLTGELNLTESQICQVFSGQIQTWGQLLGNGSALPITLVYRSDNSGTSFNFSNHLSTVCPAAVGGPVSGVFTINSQFGPTGTAGVTPGADANMNAAGNTVTNGSSASVTAIGENGNGAVVAEILATSGAIGYAELADAVDRAAAAGGSALSYASVSIQANVPTTYYCALTPTITSLTKVTCAGKGNKLVTVKAKTFKAWDPLTGFAKSVKVNFVSDKVLVANNSSALETLTAAGFTATHPGCMQVVDPTTIAVPALKTGEYTNYPIMAVTYLLGYNTGNSITSGSTTTDVHSFVAALLASPYAISSKVKTVGLKTGYAALTPVLDSGAAGGATKAATLVANCVLQ